MRWPKEATVSAPHSAPGPFALMHPNSRSDHCLDSCWHRGVFCWSYSHDACVAGFDHRANGSMAALRRTPWGTVRAADGRLFGQRIHRRLLVFRRLGLFSSCCYYSHSHTPIYLALACLAWAAGGMLLYFSTTKHTDQTMCGGMNARAGNGIWALVFGGMMPRWIGSGVLSHGFGVSRRLQ